MNEIAERLLQPAINVGLSEFDFWNMTVAEVERYLKGATWRYKTQAQLDYTLATLIGNAIGCVIGDGNMVSIEEAYPSLFEVELQEKQEAIEAEKKTMNSVNNFLEFAKRHNSKKSKGVENNHNGRDIKN